MALNRRTQELDTVEANVSLKSTPSHCLKPRVTNLDFALTTQPCSSTFHVYTHMASITLTTDCYAGAGAKVLACPPDALSVTICLHEAISRHRTHYWVWGGPMHARSAGPASLLRRYIDGRPRWLIFPSPALTPEPHGSSLIVDHGDRCIPAMRRALHESRHTSSRASTCIPRVLTRDLRTRGS